MTITDTVSPALAVSAHEGYLSDSEIARLVTIAQSVPTVIDTDADGGERVIYMNTPEADDALSRLTNAFLPVLNSVAGSSTALPYEDAFMIVCEEFISYVRRFDLSSALPFKAPIRTILSRRLGDEGRTSGLIVVKENAAARYRQLMDRHDWNLEAAYADCKAGQFAPETFLAVHRAIGVESLEAEHRNGGPSASASGDRVTTLATYEAELADPEPSPEAITVQAETIRYLFSLVPADREAILRLAYGFSDLATENSRLAAGFRADGSPMSDREVAQVLGMRTPTVNRHRNEALAVMRDALADEDDVTSAA